MCVCGGGGGVPWCSLPLSSTFTPRLLPANPIADSENSVTPIFTCIGKTLN